MIPAPPLYFAVPRQPAASGPAMTDELHTIIDLIRYGASRFNAAGLTFGHSFDNALDEATQLTLHALHLPHDIGPAYGQARVTLAEKEEVLALFLRRIEERVPAAYLAGAAGFAGRPFKSDPPAPVPRAPTDRKSVVSGKRVEVRVNYGGRRDIKTKKN